MTCTLKSDQEPAILSLKKAASRLAHTATGREVCRSMTCEWVGLAEGAVNETEGVIQSLRCAVEWLCGVVLDAASLVDPWLVRHAGSMISGSICGLVGRTSFELRNGKLHRKRLPPLAEKVTYLTAGNVRSRLVDRRMQGLFFGSATSF